MPVEKHHLEKMYQDFPDALKAQWDFERFRTLSAERVQADCAFDMESPIESHGAQPPRKPEKNEFGGLASAFHVRIDSWMPTFIEPGAFKHTLETPAERDRVRVLYQHQSELPIGKPTYMAEVPKGLLVMGRISETTLGSDTLILLRDGVISEMSIGFDPVEFTFKENDKKEMCRHITGVRLWEFSPVTFGANKGAKITVVNSLRTPDGAQIDVDQLAELVAARLAAIQRIDEKDEHAVRAEIERLTKIFPPKPAPIAGPSAEQMAMLELAGRMVS